MNVPGGTKYARFSTVDADYLAAPTWMCSSTRAGATNLLGNGTGGSAEEEVNLPQPAGGWVDVHVDLYAGATEQPVNSTAGNSRTPRPRKPT